MSDEKIVRPEFGSPKLVVDNTGAHCAHEFVTLRSRDEAVICRTCNREVSAFAVLVRLSRDWNWATHYHQQATERAERVEELKREEQLVKSRIKSALKSAPESKSSLYFQELLRRTNAIETRSDVSEVDRWEAEFKWLTPEQDRILRDAGFRAKQRIEANFRKAKRRGVKVIAGGKGAS